jgi:hypothetical protein
LYSFFFIYHINNIFNVRNVFRIKTEQWSGI